MLKKYLFLAVIFTAASLTDVRAQTEPATTPPASEATPGQEGVPAADSTPSTPVPDPVLPANFHRAKPPYIIIKVDDWKPNKTGAIPPNWQKLVDDVNSRKIKANIGVICNSLEGTGPKFDEDFKWIKDLQGTGNFEFWFHAYDHMNHIKDGISYAEMDGLTNEEMKQKFDTCQKLAMDKLGFPFRTFGPPGGGGAPGAKPPEPHPHTELGQTIQNDPNLAVWLYPSPIDDEGKQIEAQGKVTILDRVWRVNIEHPLFKPSYAEFVDGYGRYPDREYFVIQGHPGHWKPEGFIEFEKILDFCQKQGAVFVTASEMADILKKEKGSSATPAATTPAAQ